MLKKKQKITGNASQSCSLADFRTCAIFFNEGLNVTFFIAAMYSGKPSVMETDGVISSTMSLSTRLGYSHKYKPIKNI